MSQNNVNKVFSHQKNLCAHVTSSLNRVMATYTLFFNTHSFTFICMLSIFEYDLVSSLENYFQQCRSLNEVSTVGKIFECQPESPGFNPGPGRGLNFGRPPFATPSVDEDVKPFVYSPEMMVQQTSKNPDTSRKELTSNPSGWSCGPRSCIDSIVATRGATRCFHNSWPDLFLHFEVATSGHIFELSFFYLFKRDKLSHMRISWSPIRYVTCAWWEAICIPQGEAKTTRSIFLDSYTANRLSALSDFSS